MKLFPRLCFPENLYFPYKLNASKLMKEPLIFDSERDKKNFLLIFD